MIIMSTRKLCIKPIFYLSRDTGELEGGITILLLIKILAKSCEHIYNQIHQMPFGEHY